MSQKQAYNPENNIDSEEIYEDEEIANDPDENDSDDGTDQFSKSETKEQEASAVLPNQIESGNVSDQGLGQPQVKLVNDITDEDEDDQGE